MLMNEIAFFEKLIDAYILDNKIAHGCRLPEIPELAKQFGSEVDTVQAALEAAERKHKVARELGGWIAISAAHRDHHPFSFTKSVESFHRKLTNDVLKVEVRLPLDQGYIAKSEEQHPFHEVERKAQSALGLAEDEPFLIIERFRLLDERPSALHRAYLDPSRFPETFVRQHDFRTKSLLDAYVEYGYELLYRDTVLEARVANVYEIGVLTQRYKSQSHDRVVLDAEQLLFARDRDTGKPFVLEFLKASYLEHWKYTIRHRPPGAG